MSDPDRGAYTPPTDEPLAFDARAPQTRRPLPLTLIASGAVLVVLIAAVFLFYRSGVRGANEPPRAVGQPIAQMKIAPPEEAKPIDDAAALDVYVEDGQQTADANAPTFTSAPEEPQPRPAAQPMTPTPAPTAPVQVAQAPAVQPAPVKPAPVEPVLRPVQAAAPPAPKPAPKPVVVAEARSVAPKPVAPKPAPVVTKPAETAVASKGGSSSVQIGAFSSTAIADTEFSKVKSAFGKYTAGKSKRVEAVERDGSTLYRTAFTGFSKEDAQSFCAALKAAGRACIVK
jgi:outer membrane biosynthesis protein TonB